ncbi:MAG: helicase HerA domain-containing protein, partial [Candidatus Paceibacteria bacterium]
MSLLVIIVILLLIILFLFSYSIFRFRGAISRALNMSLLMIRMPREVPKEDQQKQEKEYIAVTEQLFASFTAFHSKGLNRLLYGEPYLALELAVHHIGEEIYFYIAIPRSYEEVIEKQIHGFYPTAEITKVKDYNIFNPQGASAGSYFFLSKNQILPFKTYQKLETDPLGEILTAMSKLEEQGEGASLQVLIRPSHNNSLKSLASKVSKEIQRGFDFNQALLRSQKSKIIEFIETVSSPTSVSKQEKPGEETKAVTPYHEETVKALVSKFSKPLFDVNIRALASAKSEERANQILEQMENSFVQFSAPDLNSLKPVRLKGAKLQKLIFNFSFRLFNEKQKLFLSTEELASIYHFPTPNTIVPRIKFLKAKPAEPPPDLPKEGVILGINKYRGQEREVRIQTEDRRRHLYVIGQTGTGKTTFLGNLIKQDIWNGEGVGVIDPHGDLIENILGNIPMERAEEVIVFDPSDLERP